MKLIQQSDEGVPVASANWTVADYLTYWLGQVTMTIYAHVSLDEKRKALGKLGEALG